VHSIVLCAAYIMQWCIVWYYNTWRADSFLRMCYTHQVGSSSHSQQSRVVGRVLGRGKLAPLPHTQMYYTDSYCLMCVFHSTLCSPHIYSAIVHNLGEGGILIPTSLDNWTKERAAQILACHPAARACLYC
jgi:hypothetical protein